MILYENICNCRFLSIFEMSFASQENKIQFCFQASLNCVQTNKKQITGCTGAGLVFGWVVKG